MPPASTLVPGFCHLFSCTASLTSFLSRQRLIGPVPQHTACGGVPSGGRPVPGGARRHLDLRPLGPAAPSVCGGASCAVQRGGARWAHAGALVWKNLAPSLRTEAMSPGTPRRSAPARSARLPGRAPPLTTVSPRRSRFWCGGLGAWSPAESTA